MIINHKNQFCFFAIPRTASKAISKALIENIGSAERLRMHSSYDEFMAIASAKETNYFTFATVRNPMDSIVSAYFKKKNDHKGRFSRGTFQGTGRPVGEKAMKEYRFITENDADFATYFKEFYQEVYSIPKHEATIEKVDAIIRYEYLREDFTAVLKKLNLPDITIPLTNKTQEKEKHFMEYYSGNIFSQAQRVLGPLMKKWGYAE